VGYAEVVSPRALLNALTICVAMALVALEDGSADDECVCLGEMLAAVETNAVGIVRRDPLVTAVTGEYGNSSEKGAWAICPVDALDETRMALVWMMCWIAADNGPFPLAELG
jgi:hypothetical protein